MKQFEVRGGQITIDDEVIMIDTNYVDALKQIYREDKIVFAILTLAVIFPATSIIFDPEILPNEIGFLILVPTIAYIILVYVVNKGRSSVSTAESIPLCGVELIVYREGGSVRGPALSIVYSEDGERKDRQVWMLLRRWNGQKQLEDALNAFESLGIETKSQKQLTS